MSTDYKGLVLTFEKGLKNDDIEDMIKMLCLIKGVVSATPIEENVDDHINRERIRCEFRYRLYDSLNSITWSKDK